MSDFQTFVAARLVELDYKDTRTEPFVKDATVRQLKELSRKPVDFLDGSFSFNTIANQDNYGPGHTNFPLDIFEILYLYRPTSGSVLSADREIRGPIPIAELRRQYGAGSITGWPEAYSWHNGYLWIAPKPTSVEAISGDYRRDGTRDTATGAVITTSSTTHTNGWFTTGVNALRCAVILEYHLSITHDKAQIEDYAGMMTSAINGLRADRSVKRFTGGQAPDRMFGTPNVI